ncbi:hypothetical protein GW17_00002247 [Ensete ventricosum]|nr:hypothetical protein GW17_00002247 [Ensete ventricosum]
MATSKPSIPLKEKSKLVSSAHSTTDDSRRRRTSKSSAPSSPEREIRRTSKSSRPSSVPSSPEREIRRTSKSSVPSSPEREIQRTSKSSVPSSPERETRPPQRKALIRSSSDSTKRDKSLSQQPSGGVAIVTKSRQPAKKPPEKPPSPSFQPQKMSATNTVKERPSIRASSSMPRAAGSSKPAGVTDKTAKTHGIGRTQPSVRARSPGSVISTRKETRVTTASTDEKLGVTEQEHKEAQIHNEEHETGAVIPVEDDEHEPVVEQDLTEAQIHVEEHEPGPVIPVEEQEHEPVVEQDQTQAQIHAEEHEPEPTVTAEQDQKEAEIDVKEHEDLNETNGIVEEKPELQEPSSPRQEPEPTVNDDGHGDHHEEIKLHDHANEELLQISEDKSTTETIEGPQGERCETDKTQDDAEEDKTVVAESTTTENIKVDMEEINMAADEKEVDPSTAAAASKKPAAMQGKKKEAQMSNDVIEETRSKLLERKKSKVSALVGAFETVMEKDDERVLTKRSPASRPLRGRAGGQQFHRCDSGREMNGTTHPAEDKRCGNPPPLPPRHSLLSGPARRMDWWQRMVVLPVKKGLVAVAARVRARKAGKSLALSISLILQSVDMTREQCVHWCRTRHAGEASQRSADVRVRGRAGDVGDAAEVGGGACGSSKGQQADAGVVASDLVVVGTLGGDGPREDCVLYCRQNEMNHPRSSQPHPACTD